MQTHTESLMESLANVVVGYIVTVAVIQLILPYFGLVIPLNQSLIVSAVFTLLSLIRIYAIRRIFINMSTNNVKNVSSSTSDQKAN